MKAPVLFSCILGFLFSNSAVNAHCCWTKNNPGFYDLRVELKNLGTENCNLEASDIQQGTLYGSNVPAFLPANSETFYLTLTGTIVDATLTYTCGNNQRISLSMKQYVKKNHKHTSIDANSFNALDVFEQHTIQPVALNCCSSHDKFSLVSWNLSN